MTFDNRCVVCHGSGRRNLYGGVSEHCGVCDGNGYIRPVGTFTFLKMLFYLAGLIALCGLCGYYLLGGNSRPHAQPAAPASAAPPRFQDFYDALVQDRQSHDVDDLASKLDPGLYQVWTPAQCTASLHGTDLDQDLPDGKVTTFYEVSPYNFNTTDGDGKTYSTTLDHAYEVSVNPSSGDDTLVTFGEANGELTWFTPCV